MLTGAYTLYGTLDAVRLFADSYSSGYLRVFATTAERQALTMGQFDASHERQRALLQPYVAEACECLERGDDLGSRSFDEYRVAVARARTELEPVVVVRSRTTAEPLKAFTAWADAAAYLGPSFIHMTSNRLGINILEEAFLARTLRLSLDAVA
jgi:hypothetical protein